jgi:hypothetical protein
MFDGVDTLCFEHESTQCCSSTVFSSTLGLSSGSEDASFVRFTLGLAACARQMSVGADSAELFRDACYRY